VAKRSPILGYNHNVRYRGLVFHVQTEDSGVLSPHLFTHLFHGGVIVSTRKLVYDAGSNEEVIKTLMQAQHKAVLKELKKGLFDDKIDLYLGGTPGLLPSAAPSTPAVPRPPVVPEPAVSTKPTESELSMSRAKTEADPPPVLALKPTDLAVKTPPEDEATRPTSVPPAVGRAQTAERRSGRSSVRTNLPTDSPDSGSPDSIAAAVAAANQVNATVRTAMPDDADSSPEIEIQLEADEPDEPAVARSRSARDTDVAAPSELMLGDDHTRPTVDVSTLSDGIPGLVGNAGTPRPGESIPPPPSTPRRNTPNAVGASALPPARPITRPPSRPAITPPQGVSRPLPPEERRRRETDAIEVYAPAPPSVEAPPGMAERDRAGQYSQHKKSSQRIPVDAVKGERPPPGTGPIPPGLGRPGPLSTQPASVAKPQPPPIPQAVRQSERSPGQPPARPRTLTPARISSTAPAQSRTGSTGTGGVVMTRPAVIVGAPAKPTQPRVRKAREDEGRGFGQGLISEKSLDEVILAYLSEDAEEK
jgi:hypothetical protein